MLPHPKHNMDMPWFFKFWFGLIACMVAVIFATVIYIFYKATTIDPDEANRFVGQNIGKLIKNIEEGRK